MPTAAASVLCLLAPAKINLHLRVGPRRADGFHPLVTWMCTVGLFDKLKLQVRPLALAREAGSEATPRTSEVSGASPAAGAAGAVALECDLPGLPCDQRNLVVRVAEAFVSALGAGAGEGEGSKADAAREKSGVVGGIEVTLGKNIPVGAGLGGGSSDAARMLLGLDRLIGTGRAADDLSAFAARFGSDIPFFLQGPSAVCRGRGEQVTPLPSPAARWAVLVLPNFLMPTAAVYQRFDEVHLGDESALAQEPDWAAWSALPAEALLPRLVNDLEAAAFSIAPGLQQIRQEVEQLLARPVRMSGSGSSLFTLFDEEAPARAAGALIRGRLSLRAETVEVAPKFMDDLNDNDRER